MNDVFLLSLTWLAYFVIHSLLASLTVKQWVAHMRPDCMPGYRLFFNISATLLLAPPLVMTFTFRGEPLWQWSGVGFWLANGLALAAIGGIFWSMRYYDGQEFLGLRQLRNRVRSVEDQENLHISPAHRYVRHPWYFLSLLLIWSRDMDPAFLTSALAMTMYFIIGSRLEERKLMQYHGAAYKEYRSKVAGLLPLPWKVLSKADAERLAEDS